METGEVFEQQHNVYENEDFLVVLDSYPRAFGHTIVVFKPHREDMSELAPKEASALFRFCVRVVNAIKQALRAKKVYMVTMCDGWINHLHVQFLPRYPGEPIGSRRLVAPRVPLVDGDALANRIRAAFRD